MTFLVLEGSFAKTCAGICVFFKKNEKIDIFENHNGMAKLLGMGQFFLIFSQFFDIFSVGFFCDFQISTNSKILFALILLFLISRSCFWALERGMCGFGRGGLAGAQCAWSTQLFSCPWGSFGIWVWRRFLRFWRIRGLSMWKTHSISIFTVSATISISD